MKPLLLLLTLVLLRGLSAQDTAASVPHVDSCNYCSKCIVDDAAVTSPDSDHLTSTSFLPASDGSQSRYGHLLEPTDVGQKMLLPNCTVCRGCSMELSDISSSEVRFEDVRFRHGKGATNGRIFFVKPRGSTKRYILKVFCIPISKVRQVTTAVTCSVRQASERLEILLAQQKLLHDCGMQEITPRLWLTKVSAILPESGYHIRWHGVLMEEAQGITLHALCLSQKHRLVLDLLQQKLNRTQVLLGSIWDLLTSQCDRHGENVFVNEQGNLQFIDNDKAFGVVSKCGYDSLLLPGTRYHSVLRVGFWRHLAEYYRRRRLMDPGFCHGMVDPRFVIDYRCSTPNGTLGTDYPPAFQSCANKLRGMSVEEIMSEYSLSSDEKAETLKSRATDMMTHGFEWTLKNGLPRNSPRFDLPHQPPCCGLAINNHMLTCDKCWQPLLPEDFSNSTDLSLVTSLIDRGPRARRVSVKSLQVTKAVIRHTAGRA